MWNSSTEHCKAVPALGWYGTLCIPAKALKGLYSMVSAHKQTNLKKVENTGHFLPKKLKSNKLIYLKPCFLNYLIHNTFDSFLLFRQPK